MEFRWPVGPRGGWKKVSLSIPGGGAFLECPGKAIRCLCYPLMVAAPLECSRLGARAQFSHSMDFMSHDERHRGCMHLHGTTGERCQFVAIRKMSVADDTTLTW